MAFRSDRIGDDRFHDLPAFRVARQEEEADPVSAGRRQAETEPLGLGQEEVVRDLHQHAAAVATMGVGADRTAMVEIEQDL